MAHNAGALLQESVGSAIEQAGAGHVWVIDAESTDGSVATLEMRRSGVHIVPVSNRGFAAGNNRGLELTGSPFVLLLNPDAVLRPRALDALMVTTEANPRAGIVGALVLDPEGRVQANSFGSFPSLGSYVTLRLWRAAQRLRGNTGLSPRAPLKTASVDWVTGAAMLVRREAVETVGPMDEGFFLYYEDVEWCHRMRDHGWEVLLEPEARVVHHLGGSAAPRDMIGQAYRASFYRYCNLYHLWGLKTVSRLLLGLRRLLGGAP